MGSLTLLDLEVFGYNIHKKNIWHLLLSFPSDGENDQNVWRGPQAKESLLGLCLSSCLSQGIIYLEQPSSIDFKTHLRYDASLKRRGQWGDPTLSLELLPVHDAWVDIVMVMIISMMVFWEVGCHPHRPRWVQSWLVRIRWWSKLAKPCQGLGRNSPQLSILSWLSFSIPHWLLQKTD